MKRVVFIFCAWLVSASHLSWAASFDLEEHTHGMDASIAYLSMIFGVIDGVLQGSGSQIAGYLCNHLSTMLVFFASALWTYTTFVGVLNTASEGQFLGQKWSSMWIPVRTVIGFVLLMPKGTTGYSLIQVIIMSVVIQGVHGANLVWRSTLSYLENKGAIVELVRRPLLDKTHETKLTKNSNSEAVIEDDHYRLIQKAGDILKSEVCMMTMYYALAQQAGLRGALPPFDIANDLNRQTRAFFLQSDTVNQQISFPSTWKPGVCGVLTWNTLQSASNRSKKPSDSLDIASITVQRMVMDLTYPAMHIAQKIIAHTPKESGSADTLFPDPSSTGLHFSKDIDFKLFAAAQAAMGLLRQASRQKSQVADDVQKTDFANKKLHMEQAGWMVAGNYYSLIANTNRAVVDVTPDYSWFISSINIDKNSLNIDKVLNFLPKQHQRDNLKRFVDEFDALVRHEITNASNFYQKAPWITHPSHAHAEDFDSFNFIGNPFGGAVYSLQKGMKIILAKEKDPIVALSKIGSKILQEMHHYWDRFADKTIDFSSFNTQSLNAALLVPIVLTWMMLNFTIGSVLVYYVPLIPFLLFFFGSLTWLTLVIGAVLAGPLVALGFMHPEGHDFFGQAEQAIKLLASLTLRPMLMVFGLIFGMILCTVIFELFNYGYAMIVPETQDLKGILPGVQQVAVTALYTTFAVSIITRCFSLIYEVPNRALSWIGWQTEGHSEAEVLSQARNSLDQQMGGISQGIHHRIDASGGQRLTQGPSNEGSRSLPAASVSGHH